MNSMPRFVRRLQFDELYRTEVDVKKRMNAHGGKGEDSAMPFVSMGVVVCF